MKVIIRPYFALLLAIGLVIGVISWLMLARNSLFVRVDQTTATIPIEEVAIADQASGQNFKPLHVFSAATSRDGFWWVNNGGANPTGLTLSEKTLYGITENGGKFGRGTVFKMMSNGSEFLTLHEFGTNDGAFPSGALTSAGNVLFGTTRTGGQFKQRHDFRH